MRRFSPVPESNGFTLVEMLVALFVFGLISVAGVTLLRGTADGQIQLRSKLGERAALSRVSNLLEADLAQAVPQTVRSAPTETLPAFSTDGGDLFAFTRISSPATAPASGSSVIRVTYRFADHALIRSASSHSDGKNARDGAAIISGIKSIETRFRNSRGEWLSDWAPADPDLLPEAVELRLSKADDLSYRMLFLVGTGDVEMPEMKGAGAGDE